MTLHDPIEPLTGVSIGYKVSGWAKTATNGQRQKTPTAWQITEVTLTTNPADPNARVRHAIAPDAPARSGGIPKKRAAIIGVEMENDETTLDRSDIRGLCRAAGLSPEAADDLIDAGADLTRA